MRTHSLMNRWGLPLLLLSPVMALLGAVVIVPEVWALLLSFTNYRLGRPLRFIGLSNFEIALSDPNFWNAITVNAVFVAAAVLLQMGVGLYIALLLARRFRLQNFWIALILAPMAVSPAVSGVIWKYLFNFNIGPLNYGMQLLGLERQQWLTSFSLALPCVILVEVWAAIPHVIVFLYPARVTFPEELYDAASIDGATPWEKFRYITFPLLRPAFFLALVFRTMFTIRAFGVVWLLTQGGPLRSTELLAIYMFREGFQNWRFGSASAIAWVMLLITMLVAAVPMVRMYRNMFIERPQA